MRTSRQLLAASCAALALLAPASAPAAAPPHASWTKLSFANGFAPGIYDTASGRLVSMRDHVYARRSADEATRDLLFDFYFGLRAAGQNVWLGGNAAPGRPLTSAGYDGETGIVKIVQKQGDLEATQYFFAPFGVAAPVVVAIAEVKNTGASVAADAALFSLHNFHLGDGASGTDNESITWTSGAFEERGGTRLLLARPLGAATHHAASPQNPYALVTGGGRLVDVDSSGTRTDAVSGFEWDLTGLAAGETRTFGVVFAYEGGGNRATIDAALAPLADRSAAQVLADARADWTAFQARASEPSGLTDGERAVYRRSLAVLRMAQVREPNDAAARPFGQLVASLPPGMWNIAWVRDMAYGVRALVRARLYPEAHDALDFMLGGDAGDYEAYVGKPYAISVVRYFGNGKEESDYNDQGPNVEFDGFGLVLGALEEYTRKSGDDTLVGSYTAAIFERTADVLAGLVDGETSLVRADSSIWESHWDGGGRKRYAFTSATASWGLDAAARLADARGDGPKASLYREVAATIRGGLADSLVDEASGVLRGSYEETDNYLDAAAIEAFNFDALPADGEAATRTLDAFREKLWIGLTGHGYRRNDDGGTYDEREWIWVDLRIAQAARRAGRTAHADELLAWVTDQARLNFDVVPENFDKDNAHYEGEVPMAGYGAGAYVSAIWERADALGTGDDDAGPDGNPDAGPGGGNGDGGGCGCRVGTGGSAGGSPWAALPFLLLLGLLLRRRPNQNFPSGLSVLCAFAVLPLSLLLSGCGIEALFQPDDYQRTPPPRVELTFSAPAEAVMVQAYDVDDSLLGSVPATDGRIDLGDERDLVNVRLVARDAEDRVVGRTILPEAPRQDPAAGPHDAGALDGPATAAALLVDARVVYDGLSLGSTPAPVVGEMQAKAAATDTDLDAFRGVVAGLSTEAVPALGATLEAVFVDAHPTEAAAYDTALAAAVAKIAVAIQCDPSLIRVMFAVDVSGRALDGNGARQLIRQSPREGRVYLGLTVDDTSSVSDAAGLLPPKLTPNDPAYVMYDDGTNGDEEAGDAVFTRLVTLPRGMRIIYKYTDGSAGEGFTRTEEWPGNARILQIDDVVTRHADGHPDCLVLRRDSFGDEAANKNFTSLAAGLNDDGGALGWDVDLGGMESIPLGEGEAIGGLELRDVRAVPPLTPAGVAEARENGTCTRCPAPLVLATDDDIAPRLLRASFLSTTEIEIRFSEAMEFGASQDPTAYLVVDSALRTLPIRGVAALGDRVRLRVDAPDFGERYTLHVRPIPDASAAHNLLAEPLALSVGADVTAPRASVAAATSLKDLYPTARLADPTVGEVVVLTFTEELDRASAEDIAHYRIETVFGEALPVLGAFLREDGRQVMLVTKAQGKRQKYAVDVVGVKDFAGNLSPAIEPIAFEGFALYHLTVSVVPGHAWLTRNGLQRGIPRNERLYLTGTPLAVARALDGTNLSIGGRTDVTGVPEFEMPATAELHEDKPVHRIELLVPPGVYAWKAAHGVPGEWMDPPTTLEKVSKSLGTTNDATGVNVNPVDGLARNGVSYATATISLDGHDKPGPGVLFKRENPDEVCVVEKKDVACPTIVVGTWRDLDEFVAGGVLRDYDDGEPEVPPVRLIPDTAPPAPIHLEVRDSESLRISFDEGIAAGATVTATAHDAAGAALALVETRVGFPNPHEIVVQTAAQGLAKTYTLVLTGLEDTAGNASQKPLELAWSSPDAFKPFTPFDDTKAPQLLAAVPESPTTLRVRFNEKVAGSAAATARYSIVARGAATPPAILSATITGGGKDVLLTTATQPLRGEFRLIVNAIADVATPANVLASAQVDFLGFGDLDPPTLVHARAIGSQAIVLVFNEALETATAQAAGSYQIAGATVTGVEFSADPTRLSSAFDPADAPYVRNVVLLKTTPMSAGTSYAVTANVRDLSGNLGGGTKNVTGVSSAPTVDVVVEVQVSSTQTVAGSVPPRALSVARVQAEREGLFLVGIGGFPAEGSPLTGAEPQLKDDGLNGDKVAGDGVYSLRLAGVTLGSTLEWKVFASYTIAWKTAHPDDGSAAFADSAPGPSAFSDGQEFPGNENGARILTDVDGDGVVRLRHLFGDETTYKKLTMTPAFIWATGDFIYAP